MTIKLYLNARSPKADGTASVKIALCDRRKRTYIATGIDVAPSDWDGKAVRPSCRQHKALNAVLAARLAEARRVLAEMRMSGGEPTLAEVTAEVSRSIKGKAPAPPSDDRPTLAAALRSLAAEKRESTRLTYERTLRHVEAFAADTRLDEVTPQWLAAFERYLEGPVPSVNGRGLHFRNLRAAVNYAIDEGLTERYAFRRFKIRQEATPKRSLTAEQLRDLFTREVEEWQRPYRDFFLLTFALMGVNAKDLLHLTRKNVVAGRLVFSRAKTGHNYDMRIEPEAADVIGRYAGKSTLLNYMDGRADYLQFIRQANHAVQTIGTTHVNGGKRRGVSPYAGVTTYWMRHSWATIAASLDIPKETIAAALGHGGNTVTDIYIAFDRRKIDEANRRVLDWVLYGR